MCGSKSLAHRSPPRAVDPSAADATDARKGCRRGAIGCASAATRLPSRAMHVPQTWHHGLIADYWAIFNLDAPEVDLYRPYLRSPVLDAGCGAGRLLAPLRGLGYDIDGCDVSADMVARCRERVPDATLWTASLHELDPPRRYAGSIVCGVFGLGTTRAQDEDAIARLYDALLPGGPLILDNEESPWSRWRVSGRPAEPSRTTSPDGV